MIALKALVNTVWNKTQQKVMNMEGEFVEKRQGSLEKKEETKGGENNKIVLHIGKNDKIY